MQVPISLPISVFKPVCPMGPIFMNNLVGIQCRGKTSLQALFKFYYQSVPLKQDIFVVDRGKGWQIHDLYSKSLDEK